ncbi:hypothetical protein INS49_001933 [Diaporthe citri]|uniref:uncharacterized protein n=1 Tax=Diaporthe citri TaxID=83186 RepID=UPI001C7E9CC0|nr:uncharacterized protein INS49_001933 [Diaporthe citri]KAG6367738.1 hypothetical protein INS49_001933 [Diaporthe citri]
MADEDQGKILGFTKKEAEILIMSLQVFKPNQCTTNGCTALPSDLVRIGAYSNAETARTKYAALRARVMTLPNLPKPAPQTQSAATTNDRDDNEGEDEGEEGEAETSALEATRKGGKRAATRLGAVPKDYKGQPNPFLLTEQEEQLAHDRAHAQKEDDKRERSQTKRGEGVVDDDMPNQEEWDDMGDRNAW